MTLLLGVVIGAVLGLSAMGGSLIAVPLVMGALGVAWPQALGLALGAIWFASLLGVLLRFRELAALGWAGPSLAAGGLLTAPLGVWLAGALPAAVILNGHALLMALVGAALWDLGQRFPASAYAIRAASVPQAPVSAAPAGKTLAGLPGPLVWLVSGALAGVLAGLFGVGAGFVLVPALVLAAGLSFPRAAAGALAVTAVITGAAFFQYVGEQPDIWGPTLSRLASGAVLGMLAASLTGARLARWMGPRALAVVLLASAVAMLAHNLPA